MEIGALLQALHVAEQLKNNTRHSWTSDGRHESVAEHSWRVTLMAYFVKDEYPDLDMNRVLLMCLIHDLGEAFTGDIPAFVKTEEDEERESALLSQWVSSLPEPFREEMDELYREMDAQETAEARLYKALDRMETIIQHNEAPISTWLPLEYEKNLVYGKEQCAFSPYTSALQERVKNDCLEKIRREGSGEPAENQENTP
ncbi:MAG TPA: HD domain-containing protein [Candidatus Lachnoclostridium avicola]|nr:HD domain-containing protein [Candidatus Lachnoclostridium avicola]